MESSITTNGCKPGRQRKQSLLEDLEEFVDVVGLDDLGNLEEMEVFSLDHNYNVVNFYGSDLQKDEMVLAESKNHVEIEIKKASDVKKSDEPALEACDVDSLLEQFEATSEKENIVVKKKPVTKKTPITNAKEPTLAPEIIEKLRVMRSERKKSILIPPKPSNKKAKNGGLPISSPKLHRLLQPSNERNQCSADLALCMLEHDYCTAVDNTKTADLKTDSQIDPKTNSSKIVETALPEESKTDLSNQSKMEAPDAKKQVDDFFDKIPDCKVPDKSSPVGDEQNSVKYDKLPPYLTDFTNKEIYKKSSHSGSVISIEVEQTERTRSPSIDNNLRGSRSRSRSNDSVSDCSTCSTCSSCSNSSCDSYNNYNKRSLSRRQSGRQESMSRSRSRRRNSSGCSNKYSPKSRCRSTSSHSSYDDHYYSRSRSRSPRREWIGRHFKRNPRRSPSYERMRDRSRSPINRSRYDNSYNQPYSRTYCTMPPLSNSAYRKKMRDIDERRVIFVGNIPEGTTRDYLRCRFQKFGHILEVSVHFRDNRDNYGFVTFENQSDAYDAFENGNKDPNLPKFDLCFGGRRQFCKNRYADLDNIDDEEPDFWGSQFDTQEKKAPPPSNDFDALLNAAKSRLQR